MEEAEEKTTYDGLLLSVLQQEGKIDSFVGIIFGFLFRNTDFFR